MDKTLNIGLPSLIRHSTRMDGDRASALWRQSTAGLN